MTMKQPAMTTLTAVTIGNETAADVALLTVVVPDAALKAGTRRLAATVLAISVQDACDAMVSALTAVPAPFSPMWIAVSAVARSKYLSRIARRPRSVHRL